MARARAICSGPDGPLDNKKKSSKNPSLVLKCFFWKTDNLKKAHDVVQKQVIHMETINKSYSNQTDKCYTQICMSLGFTHTFACISLLGSEKGFVFLE